MVELYPNC